MTEPTDVELAVRYRQRLLAEAEDLRAASGRTSADRRPVEMDQQSAGRLNRMDAMQLQKMASAQEARRRARLLATDAAPWRLSQGDFCWCSECGTFIGNARLDLDPVIMRCIGCER